MKARLEEIIHILLIIRTSKPPKNSSKNINPKIKKLISEAIYNKKLYPN